MNKSIYGIIFMLLNTLSLAVLDISAKVLREDMSSGVIIFIYKFTLFILILPWIFKDGAKYLHTKKIFFHLLRSFLSVLGGISFYHGLKYVHMADAAALENVQYLIIVIVGMVFFHEKATKTKIAVLIIGFIGAIIIANPSLFKELFSNTASEITSAMIVHDEELAIKKFGFTILAIMLWSANTIIVKLLGNTEHNKTQMFYLLMFASMWSFPAAFIKFKTTEIFGHTLNVLPVFYTWSNINFQLWHFALLALMAACYFIHGVAYFTALKSELSTVIPFRYTKLIFSGILGYVFFAEVENTWSYIGYALIISSGLILFRYEFRKIRLNNKKSKN